MAEETEIQKNSGATDVGGAAEQTPAANGNGGQRVGRTVAAALAAAAVGTAVAAAARSRSSGGDETGTESRAARARGAVKRNEPVLTAAWTAAKGNLEPFIRSGSRRAGELVAENSPDFVRENVIPPFVEGLTEKRAG